MKKLMLVCLSLLLALTNLAATSPAKAQAEAAITITPVSMTSASGSTAGAVSSLGVKDQSGSQNIASKYVSFTTPGTIYTGFRVFTLPPGIKLDRLTRFIIRVNYRGPLPGTQAWSWWLYNYAQGKYVQVGSNSSVSSATTWTTLNFSIINPARFVSPGRQIRLQLRSNNATGDARLDYEAIEVQYSSLSGVPLINGCQVYPANNIWNTPIDTAPLHARSAAWVSSIGSGTGFHMDFGSGTWDGGPIGIPYNIVPGSQPKVNVSFYYGSQSDPGPYPIPANPLREWGSDHHILMVDKDNCDLYETYDMSKNATTGKWSGGSGAIWDLASNALRPAGWTSADAAGLPILPGLVRYEEVASGEILHAIRFTASATNSYIWPGRHLTSGSPGVLTNTPPMGARFRLKAEYDISGYSPRIQVILRAMKKYGIILADNGSDWYVSGAPDQRWNNDELHELDDLTGASFDAVDVSGWIVDPDSGQAQP